METKTSIVEPALLLILFHEVVKLFYLTYLDAYGHLFSSLSSFTTRYARALSTITTPGLET